MWHQVGLRMALVPLAVMANLLAAAMIHAQGTSQCPCDAPHTNFVTYQNIRIHPSDTDQVETAIESRIGPKTILLAGAKTARRNKCTGQEQKRVGLVLISLTRGYGA